MKSRLPFVFVFVLGLAFVLLLLTFRSIVIPAKAVAAQPAVGRRRVRDPRRRLPARLGARACSGSRRTAAIVELAAAVPLRRPLRPLDGLPRLHPQPGQGAARRGRRRPTTPSGSRSRGRPARSRAPRSSWSPSSALFATPEHDHDAADGLRPRGRGPDRRDRRPRGARCPSAMKLLGEWNWYLPRGSSGCRRFRPREARRRSRSRRALQP